VSRPRTLLLLVTALPATGLAEASVVPGRYAGKTAQGYAMRIDAGRHALKEVVFKMRGCPRKAHAVNIGDSGVKLRSGGRFRFSATINTMTFTFAGRVRGRRVTGFFRERDIGCDSGRVRFTARR
jgi:hypothetical protein